MAYIFLYSRARRLYTGMIIYYGQISQLFYLYFYFQVKSNENSPDTGAPDNATTCFSSIELATY